LLYELDSEERGAEGETVSIRLGSRLPARVPDRRLDTALDEEATRAITPAVLRGLAEIRASAGEPSAGENWQSGTRFSDGMDARGILEVLHKPGVQTLPWARSDGRKRSEAEGPVAPAMSRPQETLAASARQSPSCKRYKGSPGRQAGTRCQQLR